MRSHPDPRVAWSSGSLRRHAHGPASSRGRSLGGFEDSEVWEEIPQRGRTRTQRFSRRVTAVGPGSLGSAERTHGGIKASKQVKLACAAAPPCEVQCDREVAPSGAAEREHIAVGGNGLLRRKAWASRKPPVTRPRLARRVGLVDNCKGASGLERGQRDLREGNTLKEVA